MFIVSATNKLDRDEYYVLGTFDSYEEAEWNVENNLEWDEGDNPNDWEIEIFPEEELEEPYDLEMGFDPYEGCYTYDC